jgi:hypothetical protein
MLTVNYSEYRRRTQPYTVTNRSPRKHAGRTHAPPTGRIGGKPQCLSSAFHVLGSRTRWLFLKTNRDGTELRWHGFQRVYPIRPTYGQGTRIRAKAPHKQNPLHQEAETSYYPQNFKSTAVGDASKYIGLSTGSYRQIKGLAATLVLRQMASETSVLVTKRRPAPAAVTSAAAYVLHVLFYERHSL